MMALARQVLRPRRSKQIAYLILSAAFAAGGAWMVTSGDSRGWFVAAFFTLCTLVFTVFLLPGSAYLELGPDGITVCTFFRRDSWRWSDVASFGIARIGSTARMVVIKFSSAYPRARRARRFAELLTGHEGALPDSYGLSVEDLVALLNTYKSHHDAA